MTFSTYTELPTAVYSSNEATLSAAEDHGLTTPLVTSTFSYKISTSANNAIWVDEDLTTFVEQYQFFATLLDTHV
ncbi:hypothetical protein B9Z19DRAFT_1127036 [Tuber borchii]|uniref:Uncharacterized protein n=1 Tax=Tuber borchii TaxID=42251 RepID=A0A2T6ZS42_TUBBO|nr:hypothetical protein B9Z19DRAFT_1127036 [Tuber borchii]